MWLQPIDYEIDIEKAIEAIKALFNEPLNKLAKPFGTYKKDKERIKLDITTPLDRMENKEDDRHSRRSTQLKKEVGCINPQ